MALFNKNIEFNNSSLFKIDSDSAKNASVADGNNQPAVLSTVSTSDSVTLKFNLKSGDRNSITMSHPKEDLSDTDIQAAVDAVLENSSAFEDEPKSIYQATAKTTTTTKYDV